VVIRSLGNRTFVRLIEEKKIQLHVHCERCRVTGVTQKGRVRPEIRRNQEEVTDRPRAHYDCPADLVRR
jgi:hypothetical protein